MKDTFPKEDIQIQSSRDSLALTGRVSSKDVADRIIALATPFGKTIVNYMSLPVAPVDRQIMLKVRFVELDRTRIQQLGVNIVSTGAGNTIGHHDGAVSCRRYHWSGGGHAVEGDNH